MLGSILKILCVSLLSFACATNVSGQTVSIMASTLETRSVFEAVGVKFEKETGIKITWVVRDGPSYRVEIEKWLSGESTPDVLYWQAGERLFHYSRQGLIEPITGLWSEEGMDEKFSLAAKEIVEHEGEVFGVPYSYYQWGFYYNEKLIDDLNITPPETWSELVDFCNTMRENNFIPFSIGTKDPWTAAAWFDYIDLRLNGHTFHTELTRGKIPFTDARVKDVFRHWKQLINDNCFISEDIHGSLGWRDSLPYIYRGLAGAGLYGNFVTSDFPETVSGNIKFFDFPTIKDVPSAEEAPTDLFMIPQKSSNKEFGRIFLSYIARSDVQEIINTKLGKISTNKNSKKSDDYFISEGRKLLSLADGLTQFYDRDVPKEMADEAIPIFAAFMASADVDAATAKLEDARQRVYAK